MAKNVKKKNILNFLGFFFYFFLFILFIKLENDFENDYWPFFINY